MATGTSDVSSGIMQSLVTSVPAGNSNDVALANTSSSATLSRTDPSLLHQITAQQKEIQDLLTERRENNTRLKALEENMQKQKEEYAKERDELLAGQRAEMQQKFDALVQGWAQELSKSNPKMFEQISGGCSHVIKEGDQKDKMWQLMCCASELHQTNVKTIDTLTQANNMLQEKNRELEDLAQRQQGFSGGGRLEKRPRHEEPPPANSNVCPGHATVSDLENGGPSELWASFARSFAQENARVRY